MTLKHILLSPDPADGGDAKPAEGEGTGEGSGETNNQGDGGEPKGEATVTMTQAELDRLLAARAKRAEKAAAEKLEAERAKAEMSEAERLKAEKDEAEKKAQAALAAANARVLRAEARVAASAAGVRADRLDYALKLIDLDGIEVDDNGTVDSAALAKAVKTLLSDFPELGAAQGTAAGGDFQGGQAQGKDPGAMSMAEYAEWRKKQSGG